MTWATTSGADILRLITGHKTSASANVTHLKSKGANFGDSSVTAAVLRDALVEIVRDPATQQKAEAAFFVKELIAAGCGSFADFSPSDIETVLIESVKHDADTTGELIDELAKVCGSTFASLSSTSVANILTSCATSKCRTHATAHKKKVLEEALLLLKHHVDTLSPEALRTIESAMGSDSAPVSAGLAAPRVTASLAAAGAKLDAMSDGDLKAILTAHSKAAGAYTAAFVKSLASAQAKVGSISFVDVVTICEHATPEYQQAIREAFEGAGVKA